MKKSGSTSDFTSQRDHELYRNFLDLLDSLRDVPLRDLFGLAAKRPASRFWVSEPRAFDVVSATLRCTNSEALAKMYPEKRAMYEEITLRVKAKMAENPSLCLTQAVDAVVNEPAPRFYLTDESARLIIYRYKRRRKAQGAPKPSSTPGKEVAI